MKEESRNPRSPLGEDYLEAHTVGELGEPVSRRGVRIKAIFAAYLAS